MTSTIKTTLMLIPIACAALALTACGTDTTQRAATGAVAGGVVGGPIGAAAGAAVGTAVSKANGE
jgi:osmotically inducible lipoprotein OsmB